MATTYPIELKSTLQFRSLSMDIDKIIKAKRLDKPTPKPERVAQSGPDPELEEPELEEPEELESLAVVPLWEESVYGSGWSLAELMTEFSEK